jgi:sulfur carrier protein
MMQIEFNGEATQVTATTILALLEERDISLRGVAVALNGSVVPKSNWNETSLQDGDVVDVVTAAAGG